MHEFAINALIFAEAGRKRDGLLALIAAVDRDLIPLTAETPARALEVCRQRKVSLVLIDATIVAKNLKDFIADLRCIDPEIIRLVIVRNLREREWALKAGADAALTTGYTSERFFKVVKTLICSRAGSRVNLAACEPPTGVSPEAARTLKTLVEKAAAAPCAEKGSLMNLPLPLQDEEVIPLHASLEQASDNLAGYYAERLQAIAELLLQLSRSTQALKFKLAGLKQVEEQFARLIAMYEERNIDAGEVRAILNRLQEISAGHLQEGCPCENEYAEDQRFTYPARPAPQN